MNQLKSSIILLLLMLAAPLVALADSFKVAPADLELGKEATLQFVLDNTQEYYGFQAEVKLPDGLDAVKDSNGNLEFNLSDRAADGKYDVNSNILSNGNLIFTTFSGNHTPFNGNEGVLATLKVKVAETFTGGSVEVSKIIFIDKQNQDISLATSSTKFGVAVTGITLSVTSSELMVGESVTLIATVIPESATDKTVTWTSGDESVATVDANGKVTAKALGEVDITATCGSVSSVCRVTVVPTPVESITLSNPTLTLTVGDKATLTATVAPASATDKSISWSSSDTSVASVTASGEVTALKEGDAIITATSSNGKTATCAVNVKTDVIPVTAISISKAELEMTEGDKEILSAAVTPSNATDSSVTWTSSDPAVATVSPTGEVSAVKAGTATITAASSNGKTAVCTVTVKPLIIEATSVTLSAISSELKVGESVILTATVAPDNTTDKTAVWKSSDEAVATVVDGKVTAIALGETVITATCGSVSGSCKVTVIPTPVETIVLSESALTLTEGDDATLTATVGPDDATDKSVSWTSSDIKIAMVSTNGKVTAVAPGTATITAKAGDKTADCVVTVEKRIIDATAVTLSAATSSLKVGETITLTATVAPENTTDKTIVWKSSDETVATVADGKVIAIALGEATITATCGSVSGSCKVTVIPTPVETIILSESALTLTEGDDARLTATVGPDDATDKTVIWTSSDDTVATVDADGKVTAIAPGSATITAKAGEKTATCAVTVKQRIIDATAVILSAASSELKVGESVALTATIVPDNTTDKTITWKSSNEAVAAVVDGKVTAIALGEAVITATCGSVSGSCKVTVIPTPVETIILNESALTLTEGDDVRLTATVGPDDATDKTVIWTSSDETVATVDGDGKVTAVAPGTATITAKAGDKTADCVVTVEKRIIDATAVTLSAATSELKVGESVTLTATVAPENTTDKTVVWKSSNEAVAIVVDGKVTAIAIGEAVISATCGSVSGSCKVTVIPTPVEGLVILDEDDQPLDSTHSLAMITGDEYTLTEVVSPANATEQKVVWTSSNEEVAKIVDIVEEPHQVHIDAIAAGEATITASIAGFTTSFTVTVTDPVIAVTGIKLDKTYADMNTGETLQLNATIDPDDATSKEVTWRSSDNSIATVSTKGVVKALKAGKVTITATANKLTATCEITISDIAVAEITLDKTEATLIKGETLILDATVTPDNATNAAVTWSSSNDKVASVDQTGTVTAVDGGEAVITVVSVSNPDIKASCTVKVTVPVVGLVILNEDDQPLDSSHSLAMHTGDEYTLTEVVSPANATEQKVVWTSSDETVAKIVDIVEEPHQVHIDAIAAGEATITASLAGFTTSFKVTVTDPVIAVTGIKLDRTTAEMLTGETLQLNASIEPDDATSKEVTWRSSDNTVATVNTKGIVTALKAGKVTITASANKLTASCEITITDPFVAVEEITLDKSEATLTEGETLKLSATVAPDNATDPTVTWSSDNEAVATVAEDGTVTAVAEGKAVITAKAGDKSAVCEITVEPAVIEVSEITLDRTEVDMKVGEDVQLIATVSPTDATDSTVTWTTSDALVAMVDAEGRVTAVAEGKAVITAQAGDKTAECIVNVSKTSAVELIGLDPEVPVKVFDLNGIFVSETMRGLQQGTYIIRQGNVAKKVRIR